MADPMEGVSREDWAYESAMGNLAYLESGPDGDIYVQHTNPVRQYINQLLAVNRGLQTQLKRLQPERDRYHATLDRIRRWDNGQCGDWAYEALDE